MHRYFSFAPVTGQGLATLASAVWSCESLRQRQPGNGRRIGLDRLNSPRRSLVMPL